MSDRKAGLYLCAFKDDYSIDSRMKSRLAVAALNNAAARRSEVAGCKRPHGPLDVDWPPVSSLTPTVLPSPSLIVTTAPL